MNVSYNSKNYTLHMVDHTNYDTYEQVLSAVYICDNAFISKSYENLSYTSLENEDYIGFFLTSTDNTMLYASAIFDVNCSQIVTKFENMDPRNAVELCLICSNKSIKIEGLTVHFFRIVLNMFVPNIKNKVEHIILYVAKGTINSGAIAFYNKLGFTEIAKNIMQYTYVNHINGGKRRKTRKSVR